MFFISNEVSATMAIEKKSKSWEFWSYNLDSTALPI
jgi:hypothetical protein